MNLKEAVLKSKLGIRVRLNTWNPEEWVSYISITGERNGVVEISCTDEEGEPTRIELYPWGNYKWEIYHEL